jgi:acyl-CoA synthetase (AMP-forming)/AMP-acid ligase II/acyl carrier protein
MRTLSHAQLFEATQRVWPWLASCGIAPSARIAVLMPAGMDLSICCLAIACQAVCIPLHAGLAETELQALLGDAKADAVLGMPGDAMTARLAQKLGLTALVFNRQQWLETPSEMKPHGDQRWSEPDETAFVLFTSGTTGKPKRVPLTQRQILGSAHRIARHLELNPEDRALCVMPVYHSHGLIGGLLTPLAAGSSVVCAPAFDASEFLRWVSDFRPTWYTASPTIHHAVVDQVSRHGAGAPAHAFRLIRSASSALPAEQLARIEDVWRVPVIESYGMTETATQLASNPLPPAPRKAGSVGRPVGAELRVIDREGHALPTGQTGAVIARGPSVFNGYEDAPETDAEAFRDGWFLTGDLGRFDEDGYLFLTGRTKEQINRGGEKISPFEVEQALMRLPGVAQAVAYPVDHPTLGEDIHAAVVPAADSAVAGPFLRSCLFGVIADFKVPAFIHVVDQIPTGAGGKVQRRSLRQQVPPLVAAVPAAAPLTPLQLRIAEMFAQTLDQPRVEADANFLALGGDSLSAVRMILAVNETWGLDLHVTSLLSAPTVTAFTATIQAAIDEADTLSAGLRTELGALSDDEISRLLGNDATNR